MLSMLGLAVLVGVHHALEADHLAAVSSLVSGAKRFPELLRHGLTWGLGHATTLFVVAGLAFGFGWWVPESAANRLETVVGVMLVGLGLHVLYRLWRGGIHFHRHRHEGGQTHFHAHSHAGERQRHEFSSHHHSHRFNWRTLLVGMTHGMAGSAALLLLTVPRVHSPWAGLAYVLLFGVGSMLGMAAVSAVISVPLLLTQRFLTLANRALQGAVGLATIAIGAAAIQATLLVAP